MVDFLGNEIQVGDSLITIHPNYKLLIRCEIVGFTEKMVKIKSNDLSKITSRYPYMVIKI